MRFIMLAASAVILVALSQSADAAVWVFGDSNVDAGWYRVSPFSGHPTFDFYLANAALYGIGKPTNNPAPISVEYLAALLNMTARPANQGGTNYATSGAKNVVTNTPANGGFPNAVPTLTQIATYLQQHGGPGANDLFVIHSGGNDVGFAVNQQQQTGIDQSPYIVAQARALAKAIAVLQQRGAARIIVANQPESFGAADVRTARHLYDVTLQAGLATLHVTYAWGDANRVRQDIVANPAAFGILYTSNTPAQTACNQPSGFTTAWSLLCSAASPVSVPATFAEQTLFADDGHWASTAQRILGSYYYCLVRANWPQLAPQPLFPLPNRKPPTACSMFSEFRARPIPGPVAVQ